ncbi:hypothetical protein [Lacinutrix sp. Hel_I_90]|nr:hypothetical protein [Lacinutrix sp. Hel_I_90]
MIATKLLGLSTLLTKSKKIKIAILTFEIGVLLYAIGQSKKEQRNKRLQE